MTKVFAISDHTSGSIKRRSLPILREERYFNETWTDISITDELDDYKMISRRSSEGCLKENIQNDDNHTSLETKDNSHRAVEEVSNVSCEPEVRDYTQKKKVSFAVDSISVIEIPTNTNNQKQGQKGSWKITLDKSLGGWIVEDDPTSCSSLEYEKSKYEEIARKRLERFNSILFNDDIAISWKKFVFYSVGVIILSLSSTIPFSLVPAHDLVLHQEFWYEILFHCTFSLVLGSCVNCFVASCFINARQTVKIPFIIKMFVIEYLACISFLIATHFLWRQIIGYNYPIPFLGLIVTYCFTMLNCLQIWFSFPKDWRLDKEFQKRLKSYTWYWQIHMTMFSIYMVIAEVLRRYQNQYQPMIAICLVAIREVFLYIGCKLIKNTSNGDYRGAYIILKYVVCVNHIIILCTVIGSYLTKITIWFLILLDFGMNIFLSLKVVWLKKRRPGKVTSQIYTLQNLAICELVEFHATLSFILAFGVTYFGPNAHLFGNISNSYWTYVAIEDIWLTLGNMTLFFLVDFSSIIVSAIILWFFCKINLLKVFMALLEEFGIGFDGYILIVHKKTR